MGGDKVQRLPRGFELGCGPVSGESATRVSPTFGFLLRNGRVTLGCDWA
jgi:hypothetical protein